MTDQTSEPFRIALRALLEERDEFVHAAGGVNVAAFADRLSGKFAYESIRRVMAGERQPSARLIEQAALVLGIEPAYFREYRKLEVRKTLESLTADEVDGLLELLRQRAA